MARTRSPRARFRARARRDAARPGRAGPGRAGRAGRADNGAYRGPKLTDLDDFWWKYHNIDTRNPNPASEWLISNKKALFLTTN